MAPLTIPPPSCLLSNCDISLSPSNHTNLPVNLTTGYVSPPDGRGSLGIVWSCVFTLYACFWTILHLNIPGRNESQMKVFLRRCKWMAITAIAPEYTFLVANGQRSMARKSLAYVMQQVQETDPGLVLTQWTITHTFFADMGGIVLRIRESAPDPEPNNSGGEGEEGGDDEISRRANRGTYEDYIPVSGADIAYLIQRRVLDLPAISKEEIKEKSKADTFARIIGCIQFLWLALQCAARTAQHLTITQLELMTLLDAICALATYITWFQKPYDLTPAAIHYIDVESIPLDIKSALATKMYNHQIWTTGIWNKEVNSERIPNAFPTSMGMELPSGRPGFWSSSPSYPSGYSYYSYRTSSASERNSTSATGDGEGNASGSRSSVMLPDSVSGGVEDHEREEAVGDVEASEDKPSSLHSPTKGEQNEKSEGSLDEQARISSVKRISGNTGPVTDNTQLATDHHKEDSDREERSDNPPEPQSPSISIHSIDRENGEHTQQTQESPSISIHSMNSENEEHIPQTQEPTWNPQGILTVAALAALNNSQRQNRTVPESDTKLLDIGLLSPWILTVLICVAFGGLHCLMWNHPFPTVAEQLLWRISSIVTAVSVPAYLYVSYSEVPFAGSTVIIICFTMLYTAARLYILVESFISLRVQPSDVYNDIDWTGLLPHL